MLCPTNIIARYDQKINRAVIYEIVYRGLLTISFLNGKSSCTFIIKAKHDSLSHIVIGDNEVFAVAPDTSMQTIVYA